MPGVRSARWAGPQATDTDNNDSAAPPAARRAGRPADGPLRLCHGRGAARTGPNTYASAIMSGRLTEAPVGDNGFGYDPLFVAEGKP